MNIQLIPRIHISLIFFKNVKVTFSEFLEILEEIFLGIDNSYLIMNNDQLYYEHCHNKGNL